MRLFGDRKEQGCYTIDLYFTVQSPVENGNILSFDEEEGMEQWRKETHHRVKLYE